MTIRDIAGRIIADARRHRRFPLPVQKCPRTSEMALGRGKAIVVARVSSFPQSDAGMATVVGLYRRLSAADGISPRRHVPDPMANSSPNGAAYSRRRQWF